MYEYLGSREKIFEIAKALGCFDKYHKAPRKNPLIALIIPELDSEYYCTCAGVFEREFRERGADTIVASTRFDKEREARLFREENRPCRSPGAALGLLAVIAALFALFTFRTPTIGIFQDPLTGQYGI